jgi:serine phosphatase RsbU (regulator of sigma subunit)
MLWWAVSDGPGTFVDTLPSADAASETAVTDTLASGHHDLIFRVMPVYAVVLLVAAGLIFVFDGDPLAARVYAVTIGLGLGSVALAGYVTSARQRFRVWILEVCAVCAAAVTLGATIFFGLFSPVVMVAAMVVVLGSLDYPRIGLIIWALTSLGRVVMLALIVTHQIADRGLVNAAGLTPIQQVCVELLVQAVLFISLVGGRVGHRSTTTRVNDLLQVVRTAAQRELAIASEIQMAVLPREVAIANYEMSAVMIPATEVSGDYYDIRPAADGCWIGIGDVSGHGLTAGLVMLMVQTAVASLTIDETIPLAGIVERVNHVIHDNIRHRLKTRDFVTFSLLRLRGDGRLEAAGRHEPILVYRAATLRCEELDPEGLWLGVRPSVGPLRAIETRLAPGDTLVLHTDGLTEAPNATNQRYGYLRLVEMVNRHGHRPVRELREELERDVLEFSVRRADDLAIVVVRYVGGDLGVAGSPAPAP